MGEVKPVNCKLPDVQSTKMKSIAINSVGVDNVDALVKIARKGKKELETYVAKAGAWSWLSSNRKGTNMSRFSEILMEEKDKPMNRENMQVLLKNLLARLEKPEESGEVVQVKDVYVTFAFRYPMLKTSPVKRVTGVIAYDVELIGRLQRANNSDLLLFSYGIGVKVPITSLCPCSKKISKYGAHNQRGIVTVKVLLRPEKSLWLEDLIRLIELQGSCEVYPILKKEDEKYVTEQAYRNPKFVEDISRDVVGELQKLDSIKEMKVSVTNFESIHAHDANANIIRKRKVGKHWTFKDGKII